jgi:pilus assembly protein Flp/PilA
MTLAGEQRQHDRSFARCEAAGGNLREGRERHPMNELLLKLKSFWNREEGQGLVEYALILVLVSIVAIGALTAIGTNVTNVLQSIANTLGLHS